MRKEALQERKGKKGIIQKQDKIGLKEILRKEKHKEQEDQKDKEDQAATLIVN